MNAPGSPDASDVLGESRDKAEQEEAKFVELCLQFAEPPPPGERLSTPHLAADDDDALTSGEPPQAASSAPQIAPPAPEPRIYTRAELDNRAEPGERPQAGDAETPPRSATPMHLAASTFLSLVMVLALLLLARLMVPSLVENIRYGWYRGQLRAEYELSNQRLRSISINSLSDVSQLVSQRVGPSVVHINLLREEESLSQLEKLLLPNMPPNSLLEGQGSGFVIDQQGHILTNYHVIESSGKIEVTLSDGRRVEGRVIGVDPTTDLAVLKINASGLMATEWGDSDTVSIGTPVWAVGSPFGLQQTVTFGIISGKHRVDFRETREAQAIPAGNVYGDLMQSDVALNPGNSGGPLVDSLGQVVGVNAAILGDRFQGISFSIPCNVARRVAKQLIEKGEVARGWLGISMGELADSERYDQDGNIQPGVRVEGFPVHEPSPARDAGLQVGDILVHFEDKPIHSSSELMRLIGETEVGTPAVVGFLRNAQLSEVKIILGKREIGLPK